MQQISSGFTIGEHSTDAEEHICQRHMNSFIYSLLSVNAVSKFQVHIDYLSQTN